MKSERLGEKLGTVTDYSCSLSTDCSLEEELAGIFRVIDSDTEYKIIT